MQIYVDENQHTDHLAAVSALEGGGKSLRITGPRKSVPDIIAAAALVWVASREGATYEIQHRPEALHPMLHVIAALAALDRDIAAGKVGGSCPDPEPTVLSMLRSLALLGVSFPSLRRALEAAQHRDPGELMN